MDTHVTETFVEPGPAGESRPRASVVVPTHRGSHRLPELLDALAAQTTEEIWEVVVVLDGADAGTARLLETSPLPVRQVVLEPAEGVVAAMNRGVAEARGEIVVRCDDDLTPGPGWLAGHLAWHTPGSDVGVVSPTRDVFPDTPYARAYGRAANERALAAAAARTPDQTWISWAACNSVRRSSFVRVGGFDPRFVYGQDSELGWRLQATGTRIVIDPQLEVLHRGPTTDTATRASRAYVSGASRRLARRVHPLAHPELPRGLRANPWSALVSALAWAVRHQSGYRRAGRALDRLLAHLPAPAGRRLVALAVESAARSGELHGSDDLTVYRAQKSVELDKESLRHG